MFAQRVQSESATRSSTVPKQEQSESARFFQPKLTVNTPGDAHEQEADNVADQVMRMKEGDVPIVQRMPLTPVQDIQRKCAECENEEKEQVQRKENASARGAGIAAPSIVSSVLASGGGQSMDTGTQQFMESRFGQDFGQVRIHTDGRAAESASAIQARAYTSGRDVVFGEGEYQPSSDSGRRLLAHELAHVGQQTQDTAFGRSIQRSCGRDAIGTPVGCTPSEGNLSGPRYLFNVNCDEFARGNRADLEADAERIPNGATVEIHGLASSDGDATYNFNLSCARALRARSVVRSVLARRGINANIRIFNHGAVPGNAVSMRSVVMNVQSGNQPAPAPRPTPAPTPSPVNPVNIPDHFRVELKAWIPHRKVVDPEESVRASNILDLFVGSIPGNPIDIEFESFYRGDNHASYNGSYRVLSVVEFDWDGTNITNLAHLGSYGTSHRDYSYEVYVDSPWPIPNIPITTISDSESATATSATNGSKAASNAFRLGLASANPLVMTWAPDIDSDLYGSIIQSGGVPKLLLNYSTDGFPSHGIRVLKNGIVLNTSIVNDASGKSVLGPVGMAVISEGLLRQNNTGSFDLSI